jgi:hypothetical protein
VRPTRRTVLATSAALAAASAFGAGVMGARWWDRDPAHGLKTLSADEHDFLQAMADAWMPPGGIPALSGADAQLGLFVDDLLTGVLPTNRRLLKLLMQALDDLTLPTHLAAYRSLDRPAREAVLAGWLHHDQHLFRSAVQGLVVLMAFGWTTHPEVSPHLQVSMNCAYGR